MSACSWPAPAKVNLFLHITGRRPDGYHLLQTAFQFLNYVDNLFFTPTSSGQVRQLSVLPGVCEGDDLIVRAARLLQRTANIAQGVDIRIEKHIPMGGGLGGGSSDAATALVALNQLWAAGLSEDQLAELGLQLGADVPVFVRGYAAWAEGVGEVLTPIDVPEPWYVVVVPACHVATAEIFSDKELTRDSQAIRMPTFLAGQSHNVCEPVVRKHYPEVDEAMHWLGQYASVRMSGTGACIFASFDKETQAQSVLAQLPAGWQGFVAQGLNRSPLHPRLAREFAH